MKKSINILLVFSILMIIALTAIMCNREEEVKTFKIGLSQCADDTQWRKEMTRRIKSNAIQEGNIELIVTNGENNCSKQIKDIDSLVHCGIDLLLVSPNDVDSLTEPIAKVYKKGIPVIEIDRKTKDTNYTCFIGADNCIIGVDAAKIVDNNFKENINYVEVFGQDNASAAIDRSSGFHKAIEEYKITKNKFNLKHTLHCNWSTDEAYNEMSELLDIDTNFNVVFSHNDDMAIGVSKAIKDKNISHKIFIVGVDGVPSEEGGINAVIKRVIDATILYPNGSDEAIQTAIQILNGKDVKKYIDLNTVPIDRDNSVGLYKQLNNSRELDERLLRQDAQLKNMISRISTQSSIILLIGIILGGAVVLGIIIFRLYINNKKQNTMLCEQTAEILAQKEELESQSSYLSQLNIKLQRSTDNTLGSIRSAQTIQNAMLPTLADLNYVFNSFIIYNPKDIVSGDFYWYHNMFDGEKEINFVAVVDCTGHGVPGAFMSLIGINFLDQIVKQQQILSPAKILDELNMNIRKSLRQEETDNDDGMEAILCKIEKSQDNKFALVYEGAKFPVHRFNSKSGEMETLKTSRKCIGGKFRHHESAVDFIDKSVEIYKGDRLYLSSDGIGDQSNPERKRYTIKRLVEAIHNSVNLPMNDQKEFILNDLNKFSCECEQRDDITVLGVEII
ncbi:MAG: substrate-binding domain-containing protein [Bacteroidales bacterium]|nr:substrate-binding domain-containing protein [Bacteroidales bacterium]